MGLTYQLIHDRFKIPQGLNLLAVEGHQCGIGQAPGNGPLAFFAREQRVRPAFDPRAVSLFDHQILFGEAAPPQRLQAGQLLEESLASVLQAGKIRRDRFHIVVYILQYRREKQAKTSKPTFISSTPPRSAP